MNKKLLVLKKSISLLFSKLAQYSSIFFKAILSKKTILFVSQKKIRSYSIGPIPQLAILVAIIWVVDLFVQSLRYDYVIEKKTSEISQLRKSNKQFEKEVDSLSDNLEKINRYFKSVAGYNNAAAKNDIHSEMEKSGPAKFKKMFGHMKLTGKDRETAIKIANSNAMLDSIKDGAKNRIGDLQKKISITGLNIIDGKLVYKGPHRSEGAPQLRMISLNKKGELSKKQGGPFNNVIFSNYKIFSEKNRVGAVKIDDEIAYLATLEKFIHYAPLSKPMDNYYISSSFGERSDPIRGARAVHNGMDFVGKEGSKVLSPSIGRVVFSGKFGSYGSIVIIDHGYGISTRYGHLAKIKVARGDYVKRGDIIGIQGTSGRSTGPHLHYEVRYNNIPLNPKKFLQSGQEIFNDNQTINHVDS